MTETTLNLSIDNELKELAQKQSEEKHFSTMSDYITHLIRNDVEKSSTPQVIENQGSDVDQSTHAGIKSGPSDLKGSEIHAQSREKIRQVITKQREKSSA